MCARVAGRICCILEVVILLFSRVLVSGVCVCVCTVLLLCPLYNPVGVVLLSLVWACCVPCGRSLDFVLCRYS